MAISLICLVVLFCLINNDSKSEWSALEADCKKAEKRTLSVLSLLPVQNDIVEISDYYDFYGSIIDIPQGVKLHFSNNGCLANCSLRGNNTIIISDKKHIFDSVSFLGSWNVCEINTDMFMNNQRENVLQNLFALTSNHIYNKVVIGSGDYYLSVSDKNKHCLMVVDNTDLVINGRLVLMPNALSNYSILLVKGKNIKITGNGSIIGDRTNHLFTKGEWGMCISTFDSDNVLISGLSFSNAWGDGIYIGKGSKKVNVRNCKIENCRRQGISVIEGTDVKIQDCLISNIHGTAPEYAIDVEPNAKESASNILIKNVITKDCKGGFSVYTGKNNGSKVNNVRIEKCILSGCKKSAFKIVGANDVYLKKNTVENNKSKYVFNICRSKNVIISDNNVSTEKYVFNNLEGVSHKRNRINKGTLLENRLRK